MGPADALGLALAKVKIPPTLSNVQPSGSRLLGANYGAPEFLQPKNCAEADRP